MDCFLLASAPSNILGDLTPFGFKPIVIRIRIRPVINLPLQDVFFFFFFFFFLVAEDQLTTLDRTPG